MIRNSTLLFLCTNEGSSSLKTTMVNTQPGNPYPPNLALSSDISNSVDVVHEVHPDDGPAARTRRHEDIFITAPYKHLTVTHKHTAVRQK